MRLLYLYPEEWTGRRAREVQTLSTCAALAARGMHVTLVTAGGLPQLTAQLQDVAGTEEVGGLRLVALSRTLGPIRSAALFRRRFHQWRRDQPRFDWAYIIHLKAAAMLLHEHVLPYVYEAHEIFSQSPQPTEAKQKRLHELERGTLSGAAVRIATSSALAAALSAWFAAPNDFAIIPNAGSPALGCVVSAADGPLVYCGSLGDWKGLDLVIHASRDAGRPLKIVGGTEAEWRQLGREINAHGIDWKPRVTLAELPRALAGASAGLISTQPETASGRYSCPMKLFDYARCGLPVISTALPSLESLGVGTWCTQVEAPTREAWTQAMKSFRYEAAQAEAAQAWAARHTWAQRAEALAHLLQKATT